MFFNRTHILNRLVEPFYRAQRCFAGFLLLFLCSCSTTTWVNTGGYWLESVDTPDSVPHPSLSDSGVYSDDDLSIEVEMDVDGFAVRLLNRSAGTVRVHWDACSYTDELGIVHPVMHNEVEFYTRGAWQIPTTVRKGEVLEDFVAPSDHLAEDSEGGLVMQPLWSIHSYKKKKQAVAARPTESAVWLTLALEKNGVTSDYIFRFSGEDYQTECIKDIDYGKTIMAWNACLNAIVALGVLLMLFE